MFENQSWASYTSVLVQSNATLTVQVMWSSNILDQFSHVHSSAVICHRWRITDLPESHQKLGFLFVLFFPNTLTLTFHCVPPTLLMLCQKHANNAWAVNWFFITWWVLAHSIAAARLQEVKWIFFLFCRNALQMVILIQLKRSAYVSKRPRAYHLQNEERLQVHLCFWNAHYIAFSMNICLWIIALQLLQSCMNACYACY